MIKTSTAIVALAMVVAALVSGRRVETQRGAQAQASRELSGYSKEGNAVSGESGNVGVFAGNYQAGSKAYLASRCCAGDFYGNVFVHGNLEVDGAKRFAIDSPLDPANKYLYHAAVESSEMKNIYDGVATLNSDGEAVVELPEWFGALNRNFRYQLTPIGAPGPGLYVAQEIAGNHFTIAGGASGLKVSWMVSGVRQDAWARANPMSVEEPKPGGERGTYLHPEAFGQPSERGVEHARHPIGR